MGMVGKPFSPYKSASGADRCFLECGDVLASQSDKLLERIFPDENRLPITKRLERKISCSAVNGRREKQM